MVDFFAFVLLLPFFMRFELLRFESSDSLVDVSLDVLDDDDEELSLLLLLLDELDEDDEELSLPDELDDLNILCNCMTFMSAFYNTIEFNI